MKTIIAEKPSVAREIARIVGATKREEGYFEGGGYAVTWAFGHLVQLAMPDGYGVRGFVRDNLPIIPDTFTLVPRASAWHPVRPATPRHRLNITAVNFFIISLPLLCPDFRTILNAAHKRLHSVMVHAP